MLLVQVGLGLFFVSLNKVDSRPEELRMKIHAWQGALICSLAVMLPSCAKHKQPQPALVNNSACAGNAYLKKYNCSLSNIEQAAESGNSDAQYALGYMYYYGIGTVKDVPTAALWIRRSADQGQPLAKKAIVMIDKETSMQTTTPSHLPLARKKARKASRYAKSPASPPVIHGKGPVSHKTVKRLSRKGSGDYSIQLLASHNKQALLDFAKSNGIKNAYVVESTMAGQPWFSVLSGHYPTAHLAAAAIKQLPDAVQARSPWVRKARA